MASTDLDDLERRAARAYERAMLRRAALGAVPMALAGGAAVLLARDPSRTSLLAGFVVVVALLSFWRRRGAESAAALGFLAGLVPYVASIVASRWGGHVCTPDGCASLCLPACTVAGVVAAVIVARSAARRRAGVMFWLPASAMTIATGALGCSCAGFAGASGMVAGFVLTVVPVAIAARWRRSRS